MPDTDSDNGSSPGDHPNCTIDNMVMPHTDSEYLESEAPTVKAPLVMPDTDSEYSGDNVTTGMIMPETDSDYSDRNGPTPEPNNLAMPDTDSEYSPQQTKMYSRWAPVSSKCLDPRLIMTDFNSHSDNSVLSRPSVPSAKFDHNLIMPEFDTDTTADSNGNDILHSARQPVAFQDIENMSGSE